MNTKHLAGVLALLAATATSAAHAAPIALQDAVITATYNGSAAGMLGLDRQFAAEPGSNTTRLDPTGSGVEFLTGDYLFGIDFSPSGMLTVIANGAIPTGAYAMRFDFGTSLAAAIGSVTFTGASGATGIPVAALIDSHTIELDLGAVAWSEFGSVTAQLGTAAAVPEPATSALLLTGLAGLLLVRRRAAR
ncbi:PEP-CTERM sorting domain-containing protein [Pseudoduganella chitinolytica]|uniref:PEP-CTERM sorting domain-containing protein n=1 Tax=Pseudoduganella chitinolytica TaxID=34070 RepID=A0ABY8BEF7_9BURK|nr:PEP-CTERM sorting domain-containing protein [Pseudoduganella chitinolytica]WEF34280.1 PEP-CTERM sorting domain-containing protein [Pseudoduganella chitinolytica]